jgi:HK97 family phage major capsid protein
MEGIDEVKSLIKEQGTAWEEFKSTHAQLEQEVKKLGSADSLTEQKLAKIDAALNAAAEKKEAEERRLDALEKRMNRPGFGHNSGDRVDPEAEAKSFNVLLKSHAAAMNRPTASEASVEEVAAYKAAFMTVLRKDQRAISAEEFKALSVGADPDGGFLVPADITGRIVTRMFETSPMRAICAVQTISTDALEGIQDTDEAADSGWVSETGTRSESATPTIGKWRVPVWEIYAEPRATQQLIDDAAVDVEAWLARKVADRLTRRQNTAFVVGDGIGKPRGIADYPTAATADDTRPWGTFEHRATANNGLFPSSNPADILFDLVGAFKDSYLANARWLTRREVITAVRKFKEATTNGYLWQPGLQQGQPQQLLGFPVTIAQDMPALATGSLSMAFGDFAEAYQIVDRVGFRTLRDPYTAKPYVKFYTTARTGGGAVQFEAVKFIKFGS